MGEKLYITVPIDEDIFFKFSQVAKSNGQSKNKLIEELMDLYVKKYSSSTTSNPPEEYVKLTEELLKKWRERLIGRFANFVLRGLLERGVAEDWEVTEFQKANGQTQVERLEIPFGAYVNEKFGISFPLLIKEENLQYDKGNNFYTSSLFIDGKEFWLCSQWNKNHREKMENWIRKSLPKWFECADEDSRKEMIQWIKRF